MGGSFIWNCLLGTIFNFILRLRKPSSTFLLACGTNLSFLLYRGGVERERTEEGGCSSRELYLVSQHRHMCSRKLSTRHPVLTGVKGPSQTRITAPSLLPGQLTVAHWTKEGRMSHPEAVVEDRRCWGFPYCSHSGKEILWCRRIYEFPESHVNSMEISRA